MSENLKVLPKGWTLGTIPDLISEGIFTDGDWVESKDQDPNGVVRLIQLADVGDGYFVDKSSRYMNIETANYLNCTYLQKDDVLVARMPEPLGRACLVPALEQKSVTVVDVCIIRDKVENFSPRWLMFFINSPEFRSEIASLQSGSTRLRISRGNLSKIEFPIPPRNEQTRIVEKLEELLSDLDNGVAELKTAQAKLTQYRQSLLKSAAEGTLTQEWREANAHKTTETGEQLLARILKERRTRWEKKKLEDFASKNQTPPKDWQKKYPEPVKPDTGDLPELPDGWVWASLAQCFRIEVGATPSRKQSSYWGGSIPWTSSGEVQFSRIFDTKEKITEDGLNNTSTQINPKGSVLLGMVGEGKTRGQAAILDIDAANNQNCAAIWVPETKISSDYVFYWLWSRYVETRRSSSGNNQPALNKSLVEKMPIPISSFEEMNLIGEKLAVEFDLIRVNQLEVEKSISFQVAQRKNILKDAFSGKLVPQDYSDEPASALLEKIKSERLLQTKQSKPKQTKKNEHSMNNLDAVAVKKWVNQQAEEFTFEQLQSAFKGDYETLKEVVFEILQEEPSVIRQVFNEQHRYMTFKRS